MTDNFGPVLLLFALGLLDLSLFALVLVQSIQSGIPWMAFFAGVGVAAVFFMMITILPKAIKECYNE